MSSTKPPIWFWIIGVLALVWNGLGVNHYVHRAYNTETFQTMYTPEQIEISNNMPAWYTAAFAIAVFGATLGCIFLLLRKRLSMSLFYLSLLGVLVQMGYLLINGYSDNIPMSIAIIVVALILVWFSRHANAKGWLS